MKSNLLLITTSKLSFNILDVIGRRHQDLNFLKFVTRKFDFINIMTVFTNLHKLQVIDTIFWGEMEQ